MIESRKQYDETLDFLKINRFAYDEANEIDDLIEALREVARDIVWIKTGGITGHETKWYICYLCGEADTEGPIHEEHCPMNALPDWIIEDG